MPKPKNETPEEKAKRLEKDRKRKTASRKKENEQQTQNRLEQVRIRATESRENETQQQRTARLEQDRVRATENRDNETQQQRNARLEQNRVRATESRENENEQYTQNRLEQNRLRLAQARAKEQERKLRRSYATKNKAVSVDQAQFDENKMKPNDKLNVFGDLMNPRNKCKYCAAYKYPGEGNFCCSKGQVKLDPLPDPPNELKLLYDINKFSDNIRAYNNSLAMASIGCDIPKGLTGPNFKIQGKVYHMLGSLIPQDIEHPKFLQLYFYDTEQANIERMRYLDNLDHDILEQARLILEQNNNYVNSFRSVMEEVQHEENIKIVLLGDKQKIPTGEHERRYNLPDGCEVAALMPGDAEGYLDVVLRKKNDNLIRISNLHRSYDPLHYVIMFPYGTDGYHLGLKRDASNKTLSMVDFYSYRIQVRDDFNIITKSKRLFQQYLVDQGAKIENSRMQWVLQNQKTIKAEKYKGLLDAAESGDLASAGDKVILPPTITGCPRWYVDKFQDAMAIVRRFGKPHLFITFTCNPQWPEITNALNQGETAFDRPDITTRVFMLKHRQLMDDIVKNKVFGEVNAFVSTLEQQKRKGLHHTHNLIVLASDDAPRLPENIDKFVSAEIPDPELNPQLFEVITKNNIHGPCGPLNLRSPCMQTNDLERSTVLKNFPSPSRKRQKLQSSATHCTEGASKLMEVELMSNF